MQRVNRNIPSFVGNVFSFIFQAGSIRWTSRYSQNSQIYPALVVIISGNVGSKERRKNVHMHRGDLDLNQKQPLAGVAMAAETASGVPCSKVGEARSMLTLDSFLWHNLLCLLLKKNASLMVWLWSIQNISNARMEFHSGIIALFVWKCGTVQRPGVVSPPPPAEKIAH